MSSSPPAPLHIGIIAAEPSGDLLGGGLMAALCAMHPNIRFSGVGGTHMSQQGLNSLEPIESLSVMGLIEVLSHLPRLLGIRKKLLTYWRDNPPDVFIGIDAPDFNLPIARQLKSHGVATAHYVSPTIWAWRSGRTKTIRQATDMVLSIFPFEHAFLQQQHITTRYVGHTLAAKIPLQPDQTEARQSLNIQPQASVLALLPGSRHSEIKRLARPFLQTAQACQVSLPKLQLIVPLVNESAMHCWRAEHAKHAPELKLQEILTGSHQAMAAADVLLTASGTATFEGLLNKRPMVIGYKLHPLTHWLLKTFNLVKAKHIGMANLLADERLAPEFIQGDCEALNLAPAVLEFFTNATLREKIQDRYQKIHQSLQQPTDQLAANAITELMQTRPQLT